MKKIAILMVLMMGLLALAGCSSDNTSKMLEYDLLANVKTPDGSAADGAEVTIEGEEVTLTETADENGVVQFKDIVSGTYKVTTKYTKYLNKTTVTIDGRDITLPIQISESDAAPSTVPAEPMLDEANVISLYTSSGTYTNIDVTKWNPDWGQASSLTDYDTGEGTVKKLDLQDYQGVEFETIDITGKSTLHISYYTNQVENFDFYPIWADGESPVSSGDLITDGKWHDLEIDVSEATGIDLTTIRQFKIVVQSTKGVIYFDNIYFH